MSARVVALALLLIGRVGDSDAAGPYVGWVAPSGGVACNNGLDDDGDGTIDEADVGCATVANATLKAATTDDDESVGIGYVPAGFESTVAADSTDECNCPDESTYTNGGDSQTITSGKTNYKYSGYNTITASGATFTCVAFTSSDTEINGSNNVFKCVRFNGAIYGVRGSGNGNTITDSLIHNLHDQTGIGGAQTNLTVRRTEFADNTRSAFVPGGFTLEGNYHHAFWIGDSATQNHVEALFAGSGAGTVNVRWDNISCDPDEQHGQSGFTGAALIQRNGAQGNQTWNWRDSVVCGKTAGSLTNVILTTQTDTQVAGTCPGPINFYRNILKSGSGGYWNPVGVGPTTCNFCAQGATLAYGNTTPDNTPVAVPGGNCGP